MNAFKKLVVAGLVAAAGFSTGAHASLIGDSITATGTSLDKSPVVIGNDVEFTAVNGLLNFDFGTSTLTVTAPGVTGTKYSFADLGTYVFSGFDGVITGLSIASNGPQFDGTVVSNPSFTAHSITLDFSAAKAQNNNATLVFNIAMAGAPAQGGEVPEPGTVAIIGLGLLGLAASRRKFAKRDAA